MTDPVIDIVIPVRQADCCDAGNAPLFTLQGRTLWDITLDQALEAECPRRVVIAHDDDRFADHVAARGDAVTLMKRPPELSGAGKTTLDVLAHIAETAPDGADYLMLLEMTHPLRPKGIIDELMRVVAADRPDSLITCHRADYNYWRGSADGAMERVIGSGETGGTALYQELTGIGSIFRADLLGGPNPFGEKVDMAPIDRFWATVDIRDEDGLSLAERYLERIGATL